ncbi:MAG: hypothetical protein IT292_03065 [Deltaproteobacteria bacterium]|nr:hypothetical protein [Deltaproteobacteria bacterium]
MVKRAEEIFAEIERINAEEKEIFGGGDLPEYGQGKPISSKENAGVAESINEELKRRDIKKPKRN